MKIKASEIAGELDGKLTGDGTAEVSGVSDLKGAGENDLSFVLDKKYSEQAKQSKAVVLIVCEGVEIENKTIITVTNPKAAYAKILSKFVPEPKHSPGIDKSAVIGEGVKQGKDIHVGANAVVGKNTSIGEGTVISACAVVGENCVIGKNCFIHPNVTIYDNTIIGDYVLIHAGTVIGSDGFAFAEDNGKIVKVPQVGNVRIGNDVEIGGNCTIDKAAFGTTMIEDSVKMDNLVHIAHNVTVGAGTLIAAQTAIAGSTEVGKFCIFGGQVGVADHLVLGNGVQAGSQTGIGKNLPDGARVSGTPSRPLIELRRAEANMMKLGDYIKKIKAIEAGLNKLKDGK